MHDNFLIDLVVFSNQDQAALLARLLAGQRRECRFDIARRTFLVRFLGLASRQRHRLQQCPAGEYIAIHQDQIGGLQTRHATRPTPDDHKVGFLFRVGAGRATQFLQRQMTVCGVDNQYTLTRSTTFQPFARSRQIRHPFDQRFVIGEIGRKVVRQPLLPVHHQTGQPCDHGACLGDFRIQRCSLEGDAHIELGALAQTALERDLTAQNFCQLAGDCQALSRPAEIAGGNGIGLSEWCKQSDLGFFTHTNAVVGHLKLQYHLLCCALRLCRAHRYLAGSLRPTGILDGVIRQIDQYLAQPPRIAQNLCWNSRIDEHCQLHAVSQGHSIHGFADSFNHVFDEQGYAFNRVHFGLDPGEVQNIVDDSKQGECRVVDDAGHLALRGGEIALLEHINHADHTVHRCADLVAHRDEKLGFGEVGFFRCRFGALQLDALFLQLQIQAFAFGDIARSGEHALQLPVPVVEGACIEGHHRLLAVPGTRCELIVGDFLFAQHQFDTHLGPLRIGEVVLEWRTDQLITGATSERLHLLVDVGDGARRIGGHQRVDVGLDQGARVELLVAQALVGLLACGDITQYAGKVTLASQPHLADCHLHREHAGVLAPAHDLGAQTAGTQLFAGPVILNGTNAIGLVSVQRRYQQAEFLSDEFCARIAKHSLSRRVHGLHDAVAGMNRNDAIHHSIENRLDLRGIVTQGLLRCVLFGNITKHQHGTDHLRVAIANRPVTVRNQALAAVARNQQRMVRQDLDRATGQGCQHWNHNRLSGFLIDDTKDLLHRMTTGLRLFPTGELFGNRIEQRHIAPGIGGDHCIANRVERHGQLFLADLQGAVGLLLNLKQMLCCQIIPLPDPLLRLSINHIHQ